MSALDDIRQRAETATEGPWDTDAGDAVIYSHLADGPMFLFTPHEDHVSRYGPSEECAFDAEFIAHARTDIPRLLAALYAVLALADNAVPVIGLNGTYEGFVMPTDIRAAVNDALEARK